jgi:hypothetical protein
MPGTADTTSLRPHHVRSLALAGAVVGVVLLPIAAAQANPAQSPASQGPTASAGSAGSAGGSAPVAAVPVSGQFCGVTVTEAAEGGRLSAQACVQQENGSAIGRVFVTDESGYNQDVVLNLTRADGTVVQIQCSVAVGQTNAQCATGPVPASSGQGTYNAIAELAGVGRPVSDGVVHVESGQVAPVGD